MFFCLRNTLELDAARPVSDMAAFFGYQPAPSAALTLTLAREHGCAPACKVRSKALQRASLAAKLRRAVI